MLNVKKRSCAQLQAIKIALEVAKRDQMLLMVRVRVTVFIFIPDGLRDS